MFFVLLRHSIHLKRMIKLFVPIKTLNINYITVLFLFLFLSVSANGQTITKLQAGDHKFAKGALLVSLTDTVSSDFVEKQFEKLGYRILKNDIRPVTGYFRMNLNEKQLTELSAHPYIAHVKSNAIAFDEQRFLRSVKEQNLNARDSLRHRNMLISLAEDTFYRVTFNYYVTEEMARTFSKTIPEYEIRINAALPRSVVIETTPGKEQEVMKDVKLLVYVSNTAYLMLSDQDQR